MAKKNVFSTINKLTKQTFKVTTKSIKVIKGTIEFIKKTT